MTEQQLANIQISYGIIYTNFGEVDSKLVSPTRNGGEFKAIAKIRDISFDGSRGKEKGLQVIDDIFATLSITILDTSMETLALSIPYANFDGTVITCDKTSIGVIKSTSYIKNVTMFARLVSGAYKKITLFNALNEGDFSLAAKDKGEGEIKLEISAHWDATDDTSKLFTIEDISSLTGNDGTKPTLVSTTPIQGAVEVFSNSDLRCTFSEAINLADINPANFVLIKTDDESVIAGNLTYVEATKIASFKSTATMSLDTAYAWHISGVRDTVGNTMVPVVISFTTA